MQASADFMFSAGFFILIFYYGIFFIRIKKPPYLSKTAQKANNQDG